MMMPYPTRSEVTLRSNDSVVIYVWPENAFCYRKDPAQPGSIDYPGPYLGRARWNDGRLTEIDLSTIHDPERRYRGVGLAEALVNAALSVSPGLRPSDDLTCSGAYLTNRFLPESEHVRPSSQRLKECRRGNLCAFFHLDGHPVSHRE
ncbi:hypothetical protein [Gordonia sihwensis]|uniref:hypothetical protein n=1 Tax=Gordonia sihwensis TaxID=173559 RepID=UPI003D96B019